MTPLPSHCEEKELSARWGVGRRLSHLWAVRGQVPTHGFLQVQTSPGTAHISSLPPIYPRMLLSPSAAGAPSSCLLSPSASYLLPRPPPTCLTTATSCQMGPLWFFTSSLTFPHLPGPRRLPRPTVHSRPVPTQACSGLQPGPSTKAISPSPISRPSAKILQRPRSNAAAS